MDSRWDSCHLKGGSVLHAQCCRVVADYERPGLLLKQNFPLDHPHFLLKEFFNEGLIYIIYAGLTLSVGGLDDHLLSKGTMKDGRQSLWNSERL